MQLFMLWLPDAHVDLSYYLGDVPVSWLRKFALMEKVGVTDVGHIEGDNAILSIPFQVMTSHGLLHWGVIISKFKPACIWTSFN